MWEADNLSYWIESGRLQLKSSKLPSSEINDAKHELDNFNVGTLLLKQ